jgi:hypothetical protein
MRIEEYRFERVDGASLLACGQVLDEFLEVRRAQFFPTGNRSVPREKKYVPAHVVPPVGLSLPLRRARKGSTPRSMPGPTVEGAQVGQATARRPMNCREIRPRHGFRAVPGDE